MTGPRRPISLADAWLGLITGSVAVILGGLDIITRTTGETGLAGTAVVVGMVAVVFFGMKLISLHGLKSKGRSRN